MLFLWEQNCVIVHTMLLNHSDIFNELVSLACNGQWSNIVEFADLSESEHLWNGYIENKVIRLQVKEGKVMV